MEYYDTIAGGYKELYRQEQLKKYRLIQTHLKIREDETLLDVGCGTGLSCEVFMCKITGIDQSIKMLRRINNNSKNANFLQARGEALPFKDNIFDVIICVTAIHNFKDPKKALWEMKRVGKKKGVITIMKKARNANALNKSVQEVFSVKKIVTEDKDYLLFFGL